MQRKNKQKHLIHLDKFHRMHVVPFTPFQSHHCSPSCNMTEKCSECQNGLQPESIYAKSNRFFFWHWHISLVTNEAEIITPSLIGWGYQETEIKRKKDVYRFFDKILSTNKIPKREQRHPTVSWSQNYANSQCVSHMCMPVALVCLVWCVGVGVCVSVCVHVWWFLRSSSFLFAFILNVFVVVSFLFFHWMSGFS